MASRALGAFFALAAAAAIIVSIASSAWWAGTPVVEGREMVAKYVHAGPLGAIGCNVGGDGSCEPVAIEQTVQLVGYGELGAAGLATLFLFVLLSAALRVSDHRRGLATASLLFTLLAAGGAGALLALGPGIEASQHVDIPIGWGAYAFGGGIVASLLASLITRRLEPEPLRLKPSLTQIEAPVEAREQHTPQRASRPQMGGAPPQRAHHDPQGAMAVAHAATVPVTPQTPPPRESPPIATPPSQPTYEPPRTPSGAPRMGPSTPALSNRAQASTAAPSNPAAAGSSPRIRPPADEQVNPFARTKPPTDPPDARPRSPSSPPPRPSQPGMTPPRTKPASDAPPLRPSGSSLASSSGSRLPGMPPMREKPTTEPPGMSPMRDKPTTQPPGMPPMRSKPTTQPPSMPPMRDKPTTQPPGMPMRGKFATDAPQGTPPGHDKSTTDAPFGSRSKPATDGPPGVPPGRDKSTTDAPFGSRSKPTADAPFGTRSKPTADAPFGTRSKPTTDAPPPPRGKPPTDAAHSQSPTDAALGGRDKPTADAPPAPAPARPSAPGTGDARAKPATLSPVRSVVPSPAPGLRGKAIVVPEHMRASTDHGTPPPADPKPSRGSQPGIAPPPSPRHKTLAHAVPPMPTGDEPASGRAQTEDDDSLEAAMRETDYITAVEIDHEAKAAAAAAAAGGHAKHAGLSKNAREQMGEDTAVGLLAAPPAPPLRPGDDSEFNRAGSQAERTGKTQLPEARAAAEDLSKTMEQNPKTPVPTLERPSQTPIPVLEAERRAQVPLTTAPTTLPPPKSLDAVPSGPTPACPQCEAPMNWVDEHLRFYCKSCRMYF